MERIAVSPSVIRWMFERTGKNPDQKDSPGWVREAAKWLKGDKQPTLNQVIQTARSAHIPVDYLLSDTPPPRAEVPLPDMRTIENREITEPSLELLEIVHLCQWRQEWYKDYLHRISNISCDFVGSASLDSEAKDVATDMKRRLGQPAARRAPEDRVKPLTQASENLGILVMRGSMIKSWHRNLNPEEFRGFALVDDRAPLIFINSRDSKAAQTFTLVHELAHLWLGKTALSGSPYLGDNAKKEEQWCNRVAAEFLVPASELSHAALSSSPELDEVRKLSQDYKVSTFVILIRLKTLGHIGQTTFQKLYDREKERLNKVLAEQKAKSQGGGDRRASQVNESGRLLVSAVVNSVREGTLTFTEAYDLLAVSNSKALREVGRKVGVEL